MKMSLYRKGKECRKDPAYFTPWSFVHFLGGMAMSDLPFEVAFGLHTAYEIFDVAIKDFSIQNSLGDTLAFVVGLYCGQGMNTEKFLFAWAFFGIWLYSVPNTDIG